MWTPPKDEEIKPTQAWQPPADEALSSEQAPSPPEPSFGDSVMSAGRAVISAPGKIARNLTPEKMSPHLPMAGAVIGSTIAPGPGTAVGAGLGQILSRMADVAYGRVQPKDAGQGQNFSPKEAIAPAIQTAMAGFPETTQGQAITKAAGKGLSKVMGAFSGAKPRDIMTAAQRGPEIYGAPSMEEASTQFGRALEEAGIKSEPSLESTIDPQLSQARDTALKLGKKLQAGGDAPLPIVKPGAKTGDPHALFAYNDDFGPDGAKRAIYNVYGDPAHPSIQQIGHGSSVTKDMLEGSQIPITGAEPRAANVVPEGSAPGLTAQEALQGRQAVDRIIAGTPQKDKPTLLALGNLRDQFSQKLSEISPGMGKASKTYADAILKNNLTKVMPVNKNGEYSKLAPYLAATAGTALGVKQHNAKEGAVAGGAYLFGTSPAVMGGLAAGVGALNPTTRAALLAELISRMARPKEE